MEVDELNEFEDIPTFREYLASEERSQTESRRQWFVISAMLLYTVIRVTAFVCATVIALQGNIWIGAALFALSLFMQFQFKAADVPTPAAARTKPESETR